MEHNVITVNNGVTIQVKEDWLQSKKEEVRQGELAIKEAARIEVITKSKITRMRGRLRFVKTFIELLEKGFVPIPRMEYERIEYNAWWDNNTPRIYLDKMPVGALKAIADFQPFFDEIGIVEPKSQGKNRDPIIIGIIRYARYEEHFILYWWRPDVMNPAELW